MHQIGYLKMLIDKFKKDANITGPLKKRTTPMNDNLEMADQEIGGVFESTCRKHIGGLLFLARSCRPDISSAVGILSRFLDKWNTECDVGLLQLFGYLESTVELKLTWRFGERTCIPRLIGFVDADHAGCLESMKSTSGANVFFFAGPACLGLIDWYSRRQTTVGHSSTDSEVTALNDIIRDALPMDRVWIIMFPNTMCIAICCDSSACISAVKNGYSRKLRYLKRYGRISLAMLNDMLMQGLYTLHKVDGTLNNSDMHTKILKKHLFEIHCRCIMDCVLMKEQIVW
jgi:hypothetical protein